MYCNLKGTSTRFQRQRRQDAMAERWRGVKLAAASVGTKDHAAAVRAEMDARLTAALAVVDAGEE